MGGSQGIIRGQWNGYLKGQEEKVPEDRHVVKNTMRQQVHVCADVSGMNSEQKLGDEPKRKRLAGH